MWCARCTILFSGAAPCVPVRPGSPERLTAEVPGLPWAAEGISRPVAVEATVRPAARPVPAAASTAAPVVSAAEASAAEAAAALAEAPAEDAAVSVAAVLAADTGNKSEKGPVCWNRAFYHFSEILHLTKGKHADKITHVS